MTKPVTLPKKNGSDSDPLSKPARSKKIPYAGAEGNGRAQQQWTTRP